METSRDTYSTGRPAKILKVDERTVRKMLDRGELEGGRDEGGSWRASQASVHELLQKRREEGPQGGQEPAESVRELRSRGEDLSYRLGRSEAHVELTEKSESTTAEERRRLPEDLDREREERRQERARADRMEGERERLREELETERSKGFWRRLFGGSGG